MTEHSKRHYRNFPKDRPPVRFLACETCGQSKPECEFVETIEEFLCESCASGIDDVDDDELWYDVT